MDSSMEKLVKSRMSIDHKENPDVRDVKDGESVHFHVKARKTGYNEDMFGGKDKGGTTHFEVENCESCNDPDSHEDEEKSEKPGKGEGSQDED